jgi:predicted RNase H-like HicB family nuclease
MKSFLALVHKDEDTAYGVTFPDVPGCFSAADDFNELIPNAAEALELWFEDADEEAIAPRDLEAIRSEYATDLAHGAFLIQVPYVRRITRQVRVNISLDQGTLDAIDTAAAAMKLTRSSFIAMAALNQITGRSYDWVESCKKAVQALVTDHNSCSFPVIIGLTDTMCSNSNTYSAIFKHSSPFYGGEGVHWVTAPSAEPEVKNFSRTRK